MIVYAPVELRDRLVVVVIVRHGDPTAGES
jgi:hypothetical protein